MPGGPGNIENCPPTSVLLELRIEVLHENIRSVFKEIAGTPTSGTRRSVVRIHSPRPIIPFIELRRLMACPGVRLRQGRTILGHCGDGYGSGVESLRERLEHVA